MLLQIPTLSFNMPLISNSFEMLSVKPNLRKTILGVRKFWKIWQIWMKIWQIWRKFWQIWKKIMAWCEIYAKHGKPNCVLIFANVIELLRKFCVRNFPSGPLCMFMQADKSNYFELCCQIHLRAVSKIFLANKDVRSLPANPSKFSLIINKLTLGIDCNFLLFLTRATIVDIAHWKLIIQSRSCRLTPWVPFAPCFGELSATVFIPHSLLALITGWFTI